MLRSLSLSTLLFSLPLQGSEMIDKAKVLDAVEQISHRYKELEEEIGRLKELLGVYSALEGLEPLAAERGMEERVRVRIEDGERSFKAADYERAKEDFQRAWEEAPESAVTNYNLGLAYHKLGNTVLAKKMFKVALEKDQKLDAADRLREYLDGKNSSEKDTLTAEQKERRTEMINLKNEAESYLRSQSIPLPKKRAETVAVLREMVEKANDDRKLQQDYFLEIADTYAQFELFSEAKATLDAFEESMEGEVLPEGFHTKRLALEEKEQALTELLSGYLGNEVERGNTRNLRKNQEELDIFAAQLNEFVRKPEPEDSDFAKITKRLGEFRWGGKPNRHVMVINRFEELLYSSLEGTLPIDRYQDIEGKKFLQHITRLADKMQLKQVEFKEVMLTVGNKKVPYVLLYTYVPKHESFVVVRFPKEDLS